MAFIDMLHIEKSFGSVAVLQDVSLSMERGEVVSIIGPLWIGQIHLSSLLRTTRNHTKRDYQSRWGDLGGHAGEHGCSGLC